MNSLIYIDIVIASFRVNAQQLLPILQLEVPDDVIVKFFLVIDNPGLLIGKDLLDAIANTNCILTINEVNKGVSASRNIGLEGGLGDWVLFLDDDVNVTKQLLFKYTDAIKRNPNEIGFIGLVYLPTACTNYQQAVIANGSMTMFTIAQTEVDYAWGVTANLMISRKAIGNQGFSTSYPKMGGAEDVEFCLRIREANNFKNFKTLQEAEVFHPWWNKGQPDFSRFYRYALGISILPQRNPLYNYYSFLNTIETLFVGCFVFMIALLVSPASKCFPVFLEFVTLTIILEYIVCLRIALKHNKGHLTLTAFYIMLIRSSNDAGVFIGNLMRARLKGLGERFQFNGRINNKSFAFNTNRIIKVLGYLAGFIFTLCHNKLI